MRALMGDGRGGVTSITLNSGQTAHPLQTLPEAEKGKAHFSILGPPDTPELQQGR